MVGLGQFLLAGLLSVTAAGAQSPTPTGVIDGQVVHALTTAPVRNAIVTLTAANLPIRLVAHSDGEGKFQFSGLPAGSYRLTASRGGFLERAARRPVTLGADGKVTDARIHLLPQSVMSGRVLDEQGEPLDRARVLVFQQVYRNGRKQWERLNRVQETNDAGEYRFPNLTMGRYLVQAFDPRPAVDNRNGSPPVLVSVPSYYPNAVLQQQALPVEVGVGADMRGIDIQVLKVARAPAVRVKGKVTGMPPDSQDVVSVGLVPVNEGAVGGHNVLAAPPDYAFEFNAPPGQYTILGNLYSGNRDAFGTTNLTLTEDVAGVVLGMNRAPAVTGRIRLAEASSGVKLDAVKLQLTRISTALAADVPSDAVGTLTFPKPIAPGRYAILNIRSLPAGHYVREVKLAGQEISPDDFEITVSGQMEIVLSNQAGAIRGTVVDAEGKPFPGASVTLIPTEARTHPLRLPADAAGNFECTGLRPGKYKLFAWEEVDDNLWQDPDFRKKHENRAVEITVGLKETRDAKLRAIGIDEM